MIMVCDISLTLSMRLCDTDERGVQGVYVPFVRFFCLCQDAISWVSGILLKSTMKRLKQLLVLYAGVVV
jgi:hypothetical protein